MFRRKLTALLTIGVLLLVIVTPAFGAANRHAS